MSAVLPEPLVAILVIPLASAALLALLSSYRVTAGLNMLASLLTLLAALAIVLVSSELPEVLGLSDRVLVLHEGRVTGEFRREEATPEAVMACATGHEKGLSTEY